MIKTRFNQIKENILLTPSAIIEYLFCPRFIYFMHCLNIPQHEEKRFKVLMGREVHEKKARLNKEWLCKEGKLSLSCFRKISLERRGRRSTFFERWYVGTFGL
jgi:CRISPR/Cas system-associated exonuclease Cas4 (RecB family)